MLADDLARALDPILFARDLDFEPDDWQGEVLTGDDPTLMLCTRQGGKSTTAATLGLHEAIYHAPALVPIVSPSLRQSGELFRTVMGMYRKAKEPPKIVNESALRLEMENGSRILALPGSEATVRGLAGARLLIVDEAARVADDLLAAVRPMLATTNGRFVALTTPKGRRGWFYREWTGPGRYKRIKVTADQCPRISPEFLAAEEKALGPLMFRQEYFCEFADDDTAVFASELIERAFTSEVQPLWPSTLTA